MPAPSIADLLSWWSLNETSPTGMRFDSHGGVHLTPTSTVGYGTGVQSNAVDYDLASNESLYATNPASLTFADDPFYGITWIKPTSSSLSISYWLSKYNTASAQRSYAAAILSSQFVLLASTTGTGAAVLTASSFGSITPDVWHMVCFYHDPVANEMGISVNAGTIDTITFSGGVFASSANFLLGDRAGATPLGADGLQDETNIWATVPTQDDIDWHYNGGAGRAYSEIAPPNEGILLPFL